MSGVSWLTMMTTIQYTTFPIAKPKPTEKHIIAHFNTSIEYLWHQLQIFHCSTPMEGVYSRNASIAIDKEIVCPHTLK